jgi:hypothetical protein
MKNKIIFLLLIVVGFLSCNKKDEPSTPPVYFDYTKKPCNPLNAKFLNVGNESIFDLSYKRDNSNDNVDTTHQ